MLPHRGTWTLNEFILAAGQATADNLPPTFSQIQYASRAPTLEMQERIFDVLEQNAEHAAAITHCQRAQGLGDEDAAGPAEPRAGGAPYANLELAGPRRGARRPARSRARSRETSTSSRWTTRSCPRCPS